MHVQLKGCTDEHNNGKCHNVADQPHLAVTKVTIKVASNLRDSQALGVLLKHLPQLMLQRGLQTVFLPISVCRSKA